MTKIDFGHDSLTIYAEMEVLRYLKTRMFELSSNIKKNYSDEEPKPDIRVIGNGWGTAIIIIYEKFINLKTKNHVDR